MKVYEQPQYDRGIPLAKDDYHVGFMVIIVAFAFTVAVLVVFAVFYSNCNDSSNRVHQEKTRRYSGSEVITNEL